MINEWMKTLLSLSVSGTLLLLLLLGLKRFYQNRFSRRWQYYILLLVALRFLLPVTPGAADASIVGSLFQKLEMSWRADGADADMQTTENTENTVGAYMAQPGPSPFFSANTSDGEETLAPSDGKNGSLDDPSPAAAKPFDAPTCLFVIWAFAALLFFVRRITVYQDFVRFIRAGNREIADRNILNLLSECQEKLQTKARVELSCNSLVASPVMIGFFRPNIILPAEEAEEDALTHIFLHELVHYRQKDMFYKWLIQTVICLHWFNPFVYLLGREVNRACELSCDERVLTVLDEKERRGYGDTLLSFFKPDAPYKNSQAFVSLTEGGTQLKERLGAIMKFQKKTKGVIAATVILSALLGVCFWETGAYVAATSIGDKSADMQNTAPCADGSVTEDGDRAHGISGQITDPDHPATVLSGTQAEELLTEPLTELSDPAADLKEIKFHTVKIISDERCLYLLFSMKANDGARLAGDGRFADMELLFPGKMMSGAYQQYFLERKDGVPENELEGVIYADWQADAKANELVLRFSDWQEKAMCEDVKVDFNVSELVASAGENAELSCLYDPNEERYLWQPGNAEIKLPYSGIAICNAGWEEGTLQMVMKCSRTAADCQMYRNWYFIDTRTDQVIRPKTSAHFRTQDRFDLPTETPDDYYIWQFASVEKEALPYLEMHWGGREIYTPAFSGEWKVRMEETPVTEKSKRLAEDFWLSYAGEELHVDRIECSKLSLGVYFTDYVDPTTGIRGEFAAFDTDGNPLRCDWGFTADANDSGCMFWTRFAEPFDPERIGLLTFGQEVIFRK